MKPATKASLQKQWKDNGRLRAAVGLAALILVLHVTVLLSDWRKQLMDEWRAGDRLLKRLLEAGSDTQWTSRQADAAQRLSGLLERFPEVDGAGAAQAEWQARLSAWAGETGIQQARVRTEAATPIEGVPSLWQVVARIDGMGEAIAAGRLLKRLSVEPWVRVERLEIRDGSPGQVQVIVVAHFKQAEGDGGEDD